jgi:hypothetical protein
MTEQETVLQRPKTFADVMFGNVALYLGTAAKVVTEPAVRAQENLQGYRQMENRRILEMFGLRARKFRTPLRRRILAKVV